MREIITWLDDLGLLMPLTVSIFLGIVSIVFRIIGKPESKYDPEQTYEDPLIEFQKALKIIEHNDAVRRRQEQEYRSLLAEIWEGDKG